MLKSTTSWICDSCGEPVIEAKDGWVEWITYRGSSTPKKQGHGMRLVHHKTASPRQNSCYYDTDFIFKNGQGLVSDMHLQDFQGADGLMYLLGLAADNAVPTIEILEMIKRIHIPGYEAARLHLSQAVSEGVYEPNTHRDFSHQYQIESVVKWLEELNAITR